MKTPFKKEPHFENENMFLEKWKVIKKRKDLFAKIWLIFSLCLTVLQKCGAINDEW